MNNGGTVVESLIVEWRADHAKYQQDMNQVKQTTQQTKNEVQQAVNSTKNLTREAGMAGGSVGSMGQQAVAAAGKMEGFATKVAAATSVLLVMKKVAADTWDAVKLAMDVHESEELFETSLGNMAGDTRNWSEAIADSLGTSADEVRRTTGLWYTMIKSMGLGQDEALAMSKSLVQLKYDLMSFYNIDAGRAETIIKGMVTGETEPAKQIGVILTEQAAKRALVTNGIIEEGQEVDHTTLMYGRYLSMMEQTVVAQGDMARTIDSPANQMRVLQTELRELQLAWGEAFLPIAQTAIPMLTSLLSVLQPVTQLIGSLNNMVFGNRQGMVLGGFSMNSIATPTVQTTKATKEGDNAWKSYGSSAAGATKQAKAGVQELKNSILGFDQINKLTDSSSGGGGGVLGPGGGGGGVTIPPIDYGGLFEIDAGDLDLEATKTKSKLEETWDGLVSWWKNFKENNRLIGTLAEQILPRVLLPGGAFLSNALGIADLRAPGIPEYDFVPDDISEKTQAKLDPLMEVWHNTQAQIRQWAWGNVEITNQMAADMTKSVIEMGNDITALIDGDTQEQYDIMREYFDNNDTLTEQREAEILQSIITNGNNKKRETQGYTRRISEIYQNAANEHRSLTAEEEAEVSSLMLKMRDTGIEAAAESSDEQQKIYKHLQKQTSVISARQAADIVAASIQAKNDTIAAANERYDKEIKAANRLYEVGDITKAEYDAMVLAAETARDDAVAAAEESHTKIITEAKLQAEGHAGWVDWETGEVLTSWGWLKKRGLEIWNGIWEGLKPIKDFFVDLWDEITGKGRKVNEKAIPSATAAAGPQGGAGMRPGNFDDLYYPKKTSTSQTGNARSILGYATGGNPQAGELFIANEPGIPPEYIGTLGGRTAVANNHQIVDGISAGVFNAVSAAVAMSNGSGSNQPITIYVGGNKLLDTVVEVNKRESARTGRRVIQVGV